jgi:hypothetical protein
MGILQTILQMALSGPYHPGLFTVLTDNSVKISLNDPTKRTIKVTVKIVGSALCPGSASVDLKVARAVKGKQHR